MGFWPVTGIMGELIYAVAGLLTLGRKDVQTYPLKLKDDAILVNPHPNGSDPIARWKKQLHRGEELYAEEKI